MLCVFVYVYGFWECVYLYLWVFCFVYNDFILYCFVWLCSYICFVLISFRFFDLFVFCVFHWLVIDFYVFFYALRLF